MHILNSFYTEGLSENEIDCLNALQIYKLIFEDKRKLEDNEYAAEAVNYFARKENYEHAIQLAEKIENKGLIRNIYENAYNYFVENKKYVDAAQVAQKAGMPRDKVDNCLKKAKTDCSKNKEQLNKVFLACMGIF